MSTTKTLPPLIAAQLNYLLSNSPFPVKVDHIRSGSKNALYLDRFTLMIPFCLDYIKWDVIYNAQYPLAAPDVVFSADDQGFHPFPIVGGEGEAKGAEQSKVRRSSLDNWSIRDPTGLLCLVTELREMYLEYQRKRVAELDDARLKFEISTVLSRKGLEVCLVSSPDRVQQGEVKFSLPLLDFSLNALVHYCPWKQEQMIHLQVIFPVTQKYSAPLPPRLKLDSSLDLKMFFPIEDVKLPVWLDGMCMAEYIPILEENLKTQILDASASLCARRRFIEALALHFGRPLEADPIFCRRATVFVVSGVFSFLVHFSLTSQFPKQQPVLIMQSSCHFNSQGTPITSPPLRDYPWSPRWEASHMAERIFEYIGNESMNFKNYCYDCIPQKQ